VPVRGVIVACCLDCVLAFVISGVVKIFLQRVFEALKSIFRYSKTTRTECVKAHFVSIVQIKELGEIFLMV
jgi:hypothetical protein